MAMSAKETLAVQLERLRALYTLLAFVPEGPRHDELLARTRIAIAEVRETRRALTATSRRPKAGLEQTSTNDGTAAAG